jgi:N-acyl-D-amino-acid deacylase
VRKTPRIDLIVYALIVAGCQTMPSNDTDRFDLIVRHGTVYDGSGASPRGADVGVRGDRIAAIGDLSAATAAAEIDARGRAVSPGFINMLSWAPVSLLADGRSLSDLRQGVTLEVFGEGWSMGPWNEAMKEEDRKFQTDFEYDIAWTTLGEYLDHVVAKGITTNVASFVGASTVRIHVLGYENRPPTPAELERMRELVRQAMRDGALGVGSSLIYAPAFYADTEELVALATAAGEFGGAYISHLRSEGDRFLEALEELITIGREAGVHAEVYHLKAAGEANWPKMAQAIARIEAARREGLSISADMYPYTAGATGLNACMAPAVQEGGSEQWFARLRDPAVRARVEAEFWRPGDGWENLCAAAGSADRIVAIGFRQQRLKALTGRSLAQIAAERGVAPETAAVDLILADESRIDTAFFLMSEENVRLGLSQPWVALGSDADSQAPEGPFLLSQPHPRTYGSFARFLGRYVRDEKVTTLADAIRRLTSMPADHLKLRDRGRLVPGAFADLVVFDPATIADHATFERPQQFATGVGDVVVNGVQVLERGEPTAARPGRVVRGPGWPGDS